LPPSSGTGAERPAFSQFIVPSMLGTVFSLSIASLITPLKSPDNLAFFCKVLIYAASILNCVSSIYKG